ncbi:exodeoxyribonuclease V subunit gamma, partial [Alcanivorax sp. HI0083]
MQNGLMVLHGNRLETLTELVADWLQREPLSPLETETFLVQSNGMAQWLKLQLADALGISAGFQFQMPARFLW